MRSQVEETAEGRRLAEDGRREKNWKRWGTYLPERQWATVREDYSQGGDHWNSFSYEDSRHRVYRWGEDGLLGWCDRQCRVAVAPALWNGRDGHLKERLFGLTGEEGNHGEDVKEIYNYLDATPTHSYAKARYRYPQAAFPYDELRTVNAARGLDEPEYEITDTAVFAGDAFFDIDIEYAKKDDDTTLLRYTVTNQGQQEAYLGLLAQIWFRNVWKWGRQGEDYGSKPRLHQHEDSVRLVHDQLGPFDFCWRDSPISLLFTDNETDEVGLWQNRQRQAIKAGEAQDDPVDAPGQGVSPFLKSAFHRYLADGERSAVNPKREGTKAGALYEMTLKAGEIRQFDFALAPRDRQTGDRLFADFDALLKQRRQEADEFYQAIDPGLNPGDRKIWRQAYAGLLWSKQFYFYAVQAWLDGDPTQPAPPPRHERGRNEDWRKLYNRDVILMPDRWEYPWYAAWDLAFHACPMARLDPQFAKEQLLLTLREWYMAPSGQLPAYEMDFSAINPPVHAWACIQVYLTTGRDDLAFLEKAFHKLLLNFTWWVNRTDSGGRNVFGGGFLGLDNIGVFDRSSFPEEIGELNQADSIAWVGFLCLQMLRISVELAKHNDVYEDIASKFFEHFAAITESMGSGCEKCIWHDDDKFYYDFAMQKDDQIVPLRVRSMVGLLPLIGVEVMDEERLNAMPSFRGRTKWFLEQQAGMESHFFSSGDGGRILLTLAPLENLRWLLEAMFDEDEFLSPHGIRSLSKRHEMEPFSISYGGETFTVAYEPGESQSDMFGGNSNWRGPVWFPVNFLLIDALKRYHDFYGDSFKIELPSRSGNWATLGQAAADLEGRLASLFRESDSGAVPSMVGLSSQPNQHLWTDGLHFHEYFHGDTGAGLGSCHQTGWTALVASCLENLAARGNRCVISR